MGEELSKNVERQGWRDRALQGLIYGRFLESSSPIDSAAETINAK
jgi:hypothetical protein